MSYSKTLQPFRAGEACALTTGLGSVSFISFDIHGLPSGRFVPQHMSERTPPCVEHGFGHLCLGKLGGAHIADDDQTVSVSQFCAGDMKVMPARIGDLCRNGAGAFLVSGTLGLSKGDLVLSVVSNCRDFDAIAACGKRLEPEVNTDLSVPDREIICDLALEADIPAVPSVLHEATGFKYSLQAPALPKPEPTLEVNCGISINANCARDERYPAQRTFCSKAGPKVGAFAMQIARCGKLAADGLDSIAMQAELGCASGAELDQIESAWPAGSATRFSAGLRFALCGNTKVPDLIASDSVPGKMLSSCGVLDAKFERDDAHFGSVLRQSGPVKSASSACKPSARSLFVPSCCGGGKLQINLH